MKMTHLMKSKERAIKTAVHKQLFLETRIRQLDQRPTEVPSLGKETDLCLMTKEGAV